MDKPNKGNNNKPTGVNPKYAGHRHITGAEQYSSDYMPFGRYIGVRISEIDDEEYLKKAFKVPWHFGQAKLRNKISHRINQLKKERK